MIEFICGLLIGGLFIGWRWMRAEDRHQRNAIAAICHNHHATSFPPEVEAIARRELNIARAERIPEQRVPDEPVSIDDVLRVVTPGDIEWGRP